MNSFCRCVLLLLLTLSPLSVRLQTRLACWNVENYFDIYDDTLTRDDDFTPQGENHWTRPRFEHKRDMIYKTIAAMGFPAVFGMVEVENAAVLRHLCKGTPLRRKGYEFVHYDSPDPRGIDCALLYRSDAFRLLESRPLPLLHQPTRDVLLATGVLPKGDTLCLLVVHAPSKRGGEAADRLRSVFCRLLRATMDSLHSAHPGAWVVAMGDFNDTPQTIMRRMGCRADASATTVGCPQNYMLALSDSVASYKYQGQWEYIDQILYLAPSDATPCGGGTFVAPWLVTDDARYMGVKPFRTYQAMIYQGGVSDHLPVYLEFLCDE